MNGTNWTPEEESQLAEYLVSRVCGRAAGQLEDECLRNYPRDMYFIGNLRPRPPIDDNAMANRPAFFRELMSKARPGRVWSGIPLRLDTEEVEVTVRVRWACYYRVFPTLAQQREHQQQQAPSDDTGAAAGSEIRQNQADRRAPTAGPTMELTSSEEPSERDETAAAEEEQEEQRAGAESPEVTQSFAERRRSRVTQDSLFIRFRKISCQTQGRVVLRRQTNEQWEADISDLQSALDQETTRAQQVAVSDPDAVRTAGALEDKVRVPQTALASETSFTEFIQSLTYNVVPVWRWEVIREIRQGEPAENFVERLLLLRVV